MNNELIISESEFISFFSSYSLNITEDIYNKFYVYSELLTEWNNKINLTSITDEKGITVKHFLDSLMIFKYVDIKENSSIIDVGTGAGFPGVPMKIYREDLSVTLLDSLNKRINFLENVSRETNLKFELIHSRAEETGKNEKYREKFDISVARAVASMQVLCEYTLPFLKIGGKFIAMKGPNENIHDADNAIKILGGEISDIFEYNLEKEKRVIAVVNKISHTSSKYPRNSSQIAKKKL